MRCVVLLILLIQEGDPAAEYRSRVESAPKFTAGKLVSVGKYFADKDQHAWAREEYARAVAICPDHEDAHRLLGERRKDGGWEADPDARVRGANEKKKDEELAKIRADGAKKLADAERAIGAEWAAVGNLAEKAGMKTEAEAAWRRAIEFAPGHEAIRKKLGFEKDKDGTWMLPAEKALRTKLVDGIAKAPKGAEDAGKSEVGEKLGVTMVRRASDHYVLESCYLDQKSLEDLVQRGEHAWAMFHEVFGAKDLLKDKYNLIYLQDKTQHEKFVDLFTKGTDEQKAFSKKNAGTGGFPRRECWTGGKPVATTQDFIIHYPAQALVGALAGGRALWILEGTALWFTSGMQETAIWACVDMAGTGAGGNARNTRDPKNWPFIIKTWMAERSDPGIEALVKCTKWSEFDGAEAVKAWSLLDFLMIEHKEKLAAFLADVKTQKDTGETSLKKVYGWTLAELDARWRTWSRTAYENAK